MGAPFTQVFIQAQIDLYVAKMETATTKEYRYGQQSGGDVDIMRQDIDQLEAVLDGWIKKMDKYYPDAFAVQSQITFTEIGYKNG